MENKDNTFIFVIVTFSLLVGLSVLTKDIDFSEFSYSICKKER